MKRILKIIALFIFLFIPLCTRAEIQHPILGEESVIVSVMDDLYYFGVEGNNFVVWKLDTSGRTWTRLHTEPMNVAQQYLRRGASMAQVQGKIYFFGGYNELQGSAWFLNDLWEFDPATLRFREIMPNGNNSGPSKRIEASAFSTGAKMIIMGGITQGNSALGNESNEVWEYDPQSNIWNQENSLPYNVVRSFSNIRIYSNPNDNEEIKKYWFLIGNKRYILGRDRYSNNFIMWEYYNPPPLYPGAYNPPPVWRKIKITEFQSPSSILGPRYRDEATVVKHTDGNVYLYGGVSGNTFLNDIWKFDGTSWTKLNIQNPPEKSPSSANYGRIYATAVSHIDNNIYFFGGEGRYRDFSNNLWRFNTSTLAWEDLSPLVGPPVTPPVPQAIPYSYEEEFCPVLPYSYGRVLNAPIDIQVMGTGRKIRCSWRKKRHIHYGGFSRTYFAFSPYNKDNSGENSITINIDPVKSLFLNNEITIEGEVDTGAPNLTLTSMFWQAEGKCTTNPCGRCGKRGTTYEGDETFDGFDRQFFSNFYSRPAKIFYDAGHNGRMSTDPAGSNIIGSNFLNQEYGKMKKDGLKPVFPLNGNGRNAQISRFGGEGNPLRRTRFFLTGNFPPGLNRIHIMAVAVDFDEIKNTFGENIVQGLNGDPAHGRACGRRKNAAPLGSPFPPGDIRFYYKTKIVEFYVPEITNMSSVAVINNNVPFLKTGYINNNWMSAPNVINSLRPVVYGKNAQPNTEMNIYIGKMDISNGRVDIKAPSLNDDPFCRAGDLCAPNADEYEDLLNQGSNNVFKIRVDNNGEFGFRPVNILTPNFSRAYPHYFMFFSNITEDKDFVSAPPVKIRISKSITPPKIFNFNQGDKTNSPRPAVQGGFIPNEYLRVTVNPSLSSAADSIISSDFEGNFTWVPPRSLLSGKNIILFKSVRVPDVERNLILYYENSSVNPQIKNFIEGDRIYTSRPVFMGVVRPGRTVKYRFGNTAQKQTTADTYGNFTIENAEPFSTGSHILKIIDPLSYDEEGKNMEQILDFEIIQNDPPISAGTSVAILKKGGKIVLIKSGDVTVNDKLRIYLSGYDRIKIEDNSTSVNIPAGSVIYDSSHGLIKKVIYGGFIDFDDNDQIIMPHFGGMIYIKGTKTIEFPEGVVLSAAQDNATFILGDQGKISTIDPVKYGEEEHRPASVKTYFTTPIVKKIKIFNYSDGNIMKTLKPLFEGGAYPESLIEVWAREIKEDGEKLIKGEEKILNTTFSDMSGRFLVKINEELKNGKHYEFLFQDKSQQAPPKRLYVKTFISGAEDINRKSAYSPSISGGVLDRTKLLYKTQYRMPSVWREQVW